MSPPSARQHHRNLHVFFRWIETEGAAGTRGGEPFFTEAEITAMLWACIGQDFESHNYAWRRARFTGSAWLTSAPGRGRSIAPRARRILRTGRNGRLRREPGHRGTLVGAGAARRTAVRAGGSGHRTPRAGRAAAAGPGRG